MCLQAEEVSVKEERGENDDLDLDDKMVLSLMKGKKKAQNGPLVRCEMVKVKEEKGKGDDGDDFGEEEKPLSRKLLETEGSNKVKKEEPEDEGDGDDDVDRKPLSAKASKGLVSKRKGLVSKRKRQAPKKEDEDDEEEDMLLPGKAARKDGKEKKKTSKRLKEEKAETNRGDKNNKSKKVRKAYDLPGQKHDPPEERDPLRIFYETLYMQFPSSDMAATWMMEWGLLPKEEAKKVHERKQRKGQQQKTSVSVTVKKASKSSPLSKTVVVNQTVPKSSKERGWADVTSSDDEEDDDFSKPKRRNNKRKTAAPS